VTAVNFPTRGVGAVNNAAAETGLYINFVSFQVWFQNARAKYRRSIARQELEARSAGGGVTSSAGQQLDATMSVDHQMHHRLQNRQMTAASPTASADSGGVQQQGRMSCMSTSASSAVTGCNADYADLLDQTTTTNSVGSSMSEFLNSSLSDDVM
jgi:hypothetical protein